MAVFKKYNEADGAFGRVAEQAVQNWLINNGYAVTPLPHGAMKWDCLAESETERALVEVERRNSWASGEFHFPTVHVPVRRFKSGDAWLFIVRRDLNAALIAFFRSFLASNVVEVPNKCVHEGEQFYDMRIEWCLPIDMNSKGGEPIAVQNRRRVLQSLRDARERGCAAEYRKLILGPLPPYGMTNQEWSSLLVECNDSELEAYRKQRDLQGHLF